MRVLGIDPGSSATGFGVVERAAGGVAHRAHGTLRPRRGAPLAARLAALLDGLGEVIDAHAPEVVVVERVFVSASPRSALVLGQARGVALASAAARGLPVVEYAPSQIKQAVVGTGAATKPQVQAMVKTLLALSEVPAQDAADALAAAICHAHAGRLGALLEGEAPGGRGRSRQGRRRGGRGYVVRRAP
jgi:crossover junction endodeoxyribonuclease RuvC